MVTMNRTGKKREKMGEMRTFCDCVSYKYWEPLAVKFNKNENPAFSPVHTERNDKSLRM